MHESVPTTSGDHVAQNRAAWDRMAADYVESGRRNWASDEITWGIFDVPESRIGMLPPDLAGMVHPQNGSGHEYGRSRTGVAIRAKTSRGLARCRRSSRCWWSWSR